MTPGPNDLHYERWMRRYLGGSIPGRTNCNKLGSGWNILRDAPEYIPLLRILIVQGSS